MGDVKVEVYRNPPGLDLEDPHATVSGEKIVTIETGHSLVRDPKLFGRGLPHQGLGSLLTDSCDTCHNKVHASLQASVVPVHTYPLRISKSTIASWTLASMVHLPS